MSRLILPIVVGALALTLAPAAGADPPAAAPPRVQSAAERLLRQGDVCRFDASRRIMNVSRGAASTAPPGAGPTDWYKTGAPIEISGLTFRPIGLAFSQGAQVKSGDLIFLRMYRDVPVMRVVGSDNRVIYLFVEPLDCVFRSYMADDVRLRPK